MKALTLDGSSMRAILGYAFGEICSNRYSAAGLQIVGLGAVKGIECYRVRLLQRIISLLCLLYQQSRGTVKKKNLVEGLVLPFALLLMIRGVYCAASAFEKNPIVQVSQ